jgi:dTMP kinase
VSEPQPVSGSPGLFVVFEGGEGAGKSTQAKLLAVALRTAGREVVETREPGGTPAAESMRRILLDPELPDVGMRSEALLFAAARGDHVRAVIRPALAAGAVVVCDRYVDSSLAYQGVARGLGVEAVRTLNMWAVEGLLPQLTVVLDVDPQVGLVRAGAPDRLEREPLVFHQDVAMAFRGLAAEQPARYLVLDAQGDREVLAASILARVNELLDARPIR